MRRFRYMAASLALVGAMTVTAACSSDSKTGAGGPTSSAAPKAKLTGEPIRLGMIMRPLYLSFTPAGAEAAIQRINDAGGINGRPLELVTCSNEDKATVAAACAQKFIADPSIVATVGDNNSFGGDANPPLVQAKIAGVGTSPLGAGDFASPRIFPTNSGGLEFAAGGAFLHDELHAKSIGMAMNDTPTAQALPALVNKNVLASRGTQLSSTVAIPATAADVSAQAASVTRSDSLMLALSTDLLLRFMPSLRQQGFTGPFLISETITSAQDIKKALPPDVTKNLFAVTYFDKTSPGYKRFLADMHKYKSDVVPGDLNGVAWLSVNMFFDVASKLQTVTRDSVYDAMGKLSNYDTGGMTQPLSFTTPGTALGGSAPRLFPSVLSVYADRYEDGAYVPFDSSKQKAIPVFS